MKKEKNIRITEFPKGYNEKEKCASCGVPFMAIVKGSQNLFCGNRKCVYFKRRIIER